MEVSNGTRLNCTEGEAHALAKVLQLGILEGETLQLVLDALSLALFDLDLGDLDVPLLERLDHRFLFARA